MSGASLCSHKSVENDEELVRSIRRTPDAPLKPRSGGRYNARGGDSTPSQSTPRRRMLFLPRRRTQSCSSSDLGDMSPLSASDESHVGQTTPKKTPPHQPRTSPRISSTLFPGSNPSVHGRPDCRNRTPRKSLKPRALIEETPCSASIRSTPRTSRRRVLIPDSEGSPGLVALDNVDDLDSHFVEDKSDLDIKPVMDPISPEDFYSSPPKPRLVIDSFMPWRKNTNYVSGTLNNKKRNSSGSRSRSRSRTKSNSKKSPLFPGVWHAIKKPKKMKKAPKPSISPKDRIQVTQNKRANNSRISDSEPLSKRPRLESTPEKTTSTNNTIFKSSNRVITCTLFDNVRIEYNKGQMKMRSPIKKRKLISSKSIGLNKKNSFDFGNEGPSDLDKIQSRVNELLEEMDMEILPPKAVKAEFTDEQLMNMLESPNAKMKCVQNDVTDCLQQLDIKEHGVGLFETGVIVSGSANVLNETNATTPDNAQKATTPDQKLYPVFYSDTWKANSSPILTDISNVRRSRRKLMVPDDQYLLDAGQSSIGMVKCPKCDVIYQAGDFADEAAHNNIHNHLTELRFPGWSQERIIETFSDGRIIQVLPNDSKAWLRKVVSVLKVVDEELGFPETTFKWTSDKKVYLFIKNSAKQVVGCVVAEKCDVAYRMFPPVDDIDIDTCSRDPTPCQMGISRIWASFSHRRQKIATRLFESARKGFLPNSNILPLDTIAFSAPSTDGKALAHRIFNRFDFLVYGV